MAWNNNTKKTYPVGAVAIMLLIFVIVLVSFFFVRSARAATLTSTLKELNKKIERLEKERDVLLAQQTKYAAPNRFIEIGLANGFSAPEDEANILYLKLESQYSPTRFKGDIE